MNGNRDDENFLPQQFYLIFILNSQNLPWISVKEITEFTINTGLQIHVPQWKHNITNSPNLDTKVVSRLLLRYWFLLLLRSFNLKALCW